MKGRTIKYLVLFVLIANLHSCLNFVEDGIDIEYAESNANLIVNSIGGNKGAANETISFEIAATSTSDIKSLIIQASVEGKNGSGYNVSDPSFDDPFVDHIFGTIQPETRSFKVRYDYIVPEDINKTRINFLLIDGEGKKEVQEVLEVVPSVSFRDELVTYAKNATFNDAIASSEGITYFNIKDNYSTFTSENVDVQEKIDIMFYYDEGSKNAIIAAPASNKIDLELSIENNTLFRRLSLDSNTDLSELSPAELDIITEAADLSAEGSSSIGGIKVGEYIGFLTDLNAVNSLKRGIIKIEALHPGSVPRYDGISYVLKCSLIVQN